MVSIICYMDILNFQDFNLIMILTVKSREDLYDNLVVNVSDTDQNIWVVE